MENERMTIDEVAKVLGETPQAIRVKCARNMYDPPICRIQKRKKNRHYVFFRSMVYRYVGKEV